MRSRIAVCRTKAFEMRGRDRSTSPAKVAPRKRWLPAGSAATKSAWSARSLQRPAPATGGLPPPTVVRAFSIIANLVRFNRHDTKGLARGRNCRALIRWESADRRPRPAPAAAQARRACRASQAAGSSRADQMKIQLDGGRCSTRKPVAAVNAGGLSTGWGVPPALAPGWRAAPQNSLTSAASSAVVGRRVGLLKHAQRGSAPQLSLPGLARP